MTGVTYVHGKQTEVTAHQIAILNHVNLEYTAHAVGIPTMKLPEIERAILPACFQGRETPAL